MNRGVCLPFIAISLAVVLCCNAASTAYRRELAADTAFNQERYLSPAPRILPGPLIDPAPMVLPSNAVDATEEIEPAGAIQPAPQIQPAPVILPSDAIKEKNRAYPPAKRNGMQDSSHTRQAVQEVLIIEHQIAASEIKNKPAQPPSNTVNNNNATRAKQNGHQVFNSVILPAKNTSQKISLSWKDGHNSNSSRPNLNSEPMKQNKYSRKHKNIVKNEGKMDDSRHDGRTAKPQTEQKRKNFVKITQKKRNQNKLSKYAFYKRPKTYSESEKGHLKKNGAILYPATLYVPTPFHFTLKTTKPPTKKPQAAKVAKQKKPMIKLKKLKKCPPKIRPVEKNGARLIPTQTSFIKPTKFPTKANKAPMQKQIIRPTKKILTAQVLGGCTTADESQAKPSQQRGVVEPTQTMFIRPNERKDAAKDAPSKTTFSAQQTFNIKQQHLFTRKFKSKPADNLSESYKKHKKISKSKASVILNNRNRKLKRHFHTPKNDAHSRNNDTSKRHEKNWTKTPKADVASVDEAGSRRRRQLVFPFNIGNQEQTNPLVQQFLPNLPLQQALPDSQQALGQMITGQTGQQFLPQGALLDNQNLLSPFIGQQGLVQQQPLQQSPVFQTMKSPFLVQPQFALTPALQPASNPPSIPVLSNLEYQRPPVTGAVIPVQYQPQSVTGQSRQSIPEVSEYTEEDEYPHRRRHHHRFRSSKRNERYPYDTFSSFEDTYGKSPGIFDDLRDISSKMNKYDHDEGYYRHQPREWVENGYDEVRVRHHGRHRNPFHTEYSNYEPENDGISQQRLTGYLDDETPRNDGIDINSLDSQTSDQVTTDPKEEESLHDDDETVENSVKETKPKEVQPTSVDNEDETVENSVKKTKTKEVQPTSVTHLKTTDNAEESDEAQSKRSETIKQLDKDAVIHLDFDESTQKKDIVKDASGNQNDAHLTDGATVTSKSLGTCGRGAILKKGEVSYNGTYFKRKPTKEVSIAMWVKSKTPGFIRWFDESDTPKKSFFASTKAASVGKNHWTHLAGTFDTKTGVARIYVNGKLKVEKVGKKNNGLPQDFTSTGIGRKFGDSHVTFLDDVYMFDRVVTPEEVSALYKKCQFNRMILHYGFQHWNGTTGILADQSGLQNNATLKGGAKVRVKADCDKCGACLDLQSGDNSQVYLNASKYRQKPKSAVSISAWTNLNRTKGLHSIFQAMKDGNSNNNAYSLDIIDGKVHWQSKDKNGETIFDALTNEVTIPEGLWSHVTGTYSSKSGVAKIYVNGLLRASFHNPGEPALSTTWNRASIGGGNKPFDGLVDEFFMYNWELDPSEVRFVSKYCADKPKLVSFTVKVPIL